MQSFSKGSLALVLIFGITGCHNYGKPDEYGRERPPVDRLDPRDKGLQSKDVIESTERMAMDLLALPELNASQTQWKVVFVPPENLTANRGQDLSIFIERLRVQIAQRGRGRVALIENRDRFRDLQSRELEPTAPGDRFGQGGTGGQGTGAAGTNPDYFLSAKIMEMPNRQTSYFLCEFYLTNANTRQQVWVHGYEVKVNN